MNITIRPEVSDAIAVAGISSQIVAGIVEQWIMLAGIDYAAQPPMCFLRSGVTPGQIRHPSLRADEHKHAVNDYILTRICEAARVMRENAGGNKVA